MCTSQDSHDDTTDTGSLMVGAGQSSKLDRERLFELLSNRRRRFVIHYMKRHPDERVAMGELSTQVAAWEHGIDPEEIEYDQRKRVHTALYQHHAPKLADAGVVNYDANRGEIELADTGAEIDLSLETVGDREITWATYFTSLSVLAGLLTVGCIVGLKPFRSIPDAIQGVAVAGAFLVSSLVFMYDARTSMLIGVDGPPPEVDTDQSDCPGKSP